MVFETMVKYNGVYYMAGEDVPTGASSVAEVKPEEPKVEEPKAEIPKASKKRTKAE